MKHFDEIITQATEVKYKPVLSVLEYNENCSPGQFCRLEKNGESFYGYITNHPFTRHKDIPCIETPLADIHCYVFVNEARSPYHMNYGRGIAFRWIIIEIEDESDLSIFRNRMRLIEEMSLAIDAELTRLVHSTPSGRKKEESNLLTIK